MPQKRTRILTRWKVACINDGKVVPPWLSAYGKMGAYKIGRVMRAVSDLGAAAWGFHTYSTRKAAEIDRKRWTSHKYSPVTPGRKVVIKVEIPVNAKKLGLSSHGSERWDSMRIPKSQAILRGVLK